MVTQPLSSLASALAPEIAYPDRDGEPMSDNTRQFRWIVTIKENLEILFAQDPHVFVAGDLLWYPVEGDNKLRQAPDAMVVFGRPKGDRGSYRQWQEDNIPPQVVFEILSPGNRAREMTRKALFYQNYGVEEYYLYDPDNNELSGWWWKAPNDAANDAASHDPSHDPSAIARTGSAAEIPDLKGWVSPRLGIRFEPTDTGLMIYTPEGMPFLTPVELAQQRDQAQQQRDEAQQQRDEAQQQRDEAQQQRDQAQQQRDQAQQQAARFAEKLRELGVDPETLT
ncbi:MAG: Uma2 family endonuclease [Synechococcales cyanobacterium CRU_2_2]|nr:Uma2 family endonuclease [Synechococcales cyanobacterium CRU_2_2]